MIKINISSGEDAMDYEPSWNHTYESFAARQKMRLEEALRNQNAIEGSVSEPLLLPPPVIYLRDESGFGPADIPATECCGFEPVEDVYDAVPGG
jgi:hypothetical protein